MVAAESVVAETRETLEAATVSALQQTHAMIHRADTAEEFFQKDTTVTTREKARKKQLDVLESMKVHEEVHSDHWTLGGNDEDTHTQCGMPSGAVRGG